MTNTTVITDWRSLILQADPDWSRDSRNVIEYEFTARGPNGDERVHEGSIRVFRGDYTKRGPYGP